MRRVHYRVAASLDGFIAGPKGETDWIVHDPSLDFATVYSGFDTVLILDAKRRSESVTDSANVQQAYSYAIHPEIHTRHFVLCNGRRLAVIDIDSPKPLLDLSFESFEARWDTIERFLAPRYLLEPRLRRMAPDFGAKVARLGMATSSDIILFGVRLNTFARVTDDLFTVTANTELVGERVPRDLSRCSGTCVLGQTRLTGIRNLVLPVVDPGGHPKSPTRGHPPVIPSSRVPGRPTR